MVKETIQEIIKGAAKVIDGSYLKEQACSVNGFNSKLVGINTMASHDDDELINLRENDGGFPNKLDG